MSTTIPPLFPRSPLDAVTRRAGAVVIRRGGVPVTAHFGSPAGELSVCVRAVGLADMSELGKLLVTGGTRGVAELVRRVTGAQPAPGGAAAVAGAWWCELSPDRLVALCSPGLRPRLEAMMRAHARHVAAVEVLDVSDELAAMALVGHGVPALLGALGLSGGGGSVPRAARLTIGAASVNVLLQSAHRALLLTGSARAEQVWASVREAGRPLSLGLVGAEAVERFALLERARTTPQAPV